MKPGILLQVNRTFPPGQVDTIPEGDSLMDVPIYYTNELELNIIILTLEIYAYKANS